MWQLSLEVKTFSRVLLLALLAISTILSWAESLKDPTEVPSMVSTKAGENSTQSVDQASGPVLQSVMLGAQYRAAIINGRKVKLGEKFEKATLVALSENSATLKNTDGTKITLKMLDGGLKKSSVKMSFLPAKHQGKEIQNADITEDPLLVTSDNIPNGKVK